jgi:hypothetical protein
MVSNTAPPAETEAKTKTKLTLSVSISTPGDVGRLGLELEMIENHMLQLKVREAGGHVTLPALSMRMEELIAHNKLNLLHPGDRNALKAFLLDVTEKAPRLHISFSTEPTPAFLTQLTAWLRREINPVVLFSVGLQPAIGAGCMIRTTNKYFDLSLRQTFVHQRPLLLAQIIPPSAEVTPG